MVDNAHKLAFGIVVGGMLQGGMGVRIRGRS
jgi:hypothetical protein